MKNKQFAYVIAPEGCNEYLTPGKKYIAVCVVKYKHTYEFYFRDDFDLEHFSFHNGHIHTNDNLWVIPEIGQWPEGWTDHQKSECLIKAGVIENRAGYVRRLDEPEQPYEGETSSFSTNDFQGRTQQQVEGNYRIMSICFYAISALIVIAAILKGCN